MIPINAVGHFAGQIEENWGRQSWQRNHLLGFAWCCLLPYASGLLAREINADALLMLTDVDGVYIGWGTAQQRRLEAVKPDELNSYSFAAGSMGPKVKAAIDFVSGGRRMAGIGRLEDALEILKRRAGTIIEA